MLKQINVENFKSLKQKTSIDLQKINIFCGANSSGKSSILQTILLLTQSFSRRYNHDSIPLNGNLVRLGSMKDILSRQATNKQITLSFKLENLKADRYSEINSIDYEYSFTAESSNNFDDNFHPEITSISFSSIKETKNINSEFDSSNEISNSLNCIRTNKSGSKELEIKSFYSTSITNTLKELPDSEISKIINNSLAPYDFEIKYNQSKEIFRKIANDFRKNKYIKIDDEEISYTELNKKIYPAFIEKIDSVISKEHKDKIESIRKSKELSSFLEKKFKKSNAIEKNKFWEEILKFEASTFPKFSEIFAKDEDPPTILDFINKINTFSEEKRERIANLLCDNKLDLENYWLSNIDYVYGYIPITALDLSHTSRALTNYFNKSLKYLGPLRNEPQAVYTTIGQFDPKDVGLKGEYTAAVLHLNSENIIKYSHPEISDNKIIFTEATSTLAYACQVWLKYLGVISDYQTKDKGKLGYELLVKIDSDDEWHDLTHVGVGVSQILPIVLLSLLSEPGDTLIFEQPELHLHPKIQSRLLDLFYALSESGKQCIIETHSEYFINRLRLRIAQSEDEKLNKNCKIYFINKEKETSKIESIKINDYGSILNWPKDFFDQTDLEIENILIEASNKKRNKKNSETKK